MSLYPRGGDRAFGSIRFLAGVLAGAPSGSPLCVPHMQLDNLVNITPVCRYEYIVGRSKVGMYICVQIYYYGQIHLNTAVLPITLLFK